MANPANIHNRRKGALAVSKAGQPAKPWRPSLPEPSTRLSKIERAKQAAQRPKKR